MFTHLNAVKLQLTVLHQKAFLAQKGIAVTTVSTFEGAFSTATQSTSCLIYEGAEAVMAEQFIERRVT